VVSVEIKFKGKSHRDFYNTIPSRSK